MRQHRRVADFRRVLIDIRIEDLRCRRAGNLIRRDRRLHADADFRRRPDARRDGYIFQFLLAVRRDDKAFLFFLGRREFPFFRRRFRVFRDFDGIAVSGGRDIRAGHRRDGIAGNRIHGDRRADADRRHAGRRGETQPAAVIFERARIRGRYDDIVIRMHRRVDHIGVDVIRQFVDRHIGFGIHGYRLAARKTQPDADIEDFALALGFDGRIFHFQLAALHRRGRLTGQRHQRDTGRPADIDAAACGSRHRRAASRDISGAFGRDGDRRVSVIRIFIDGCIFHFRSAVFVETRNRHAPLRGNADTAARFDAATRRDGEERILVFGGNGNGGICDRRHIGRFERRRDGLMRGLRAEFIDSDRAAHGDRLVSGADIARNRFLRRSATRRDIDQFRIRNGRFIVFIALVDEGLRAVCPRVSRKRAVDIRALAETDSQPGAHRVNFARIVRRDAQSQSRDILIGCGNRAAENLGNRGIAERILRPAHTGRRIGRPRRGFSGRRDEEGRIRRRRRHAPLHRRQIFRQRGSHRNLAVFDRRFRRILNLRERDGSRCRHAFRFFGIRAADGRIDHERFGMTLRADIVRINRAAADIGFHIVLHARIGNGCRRRRVAAAGQRESPRRDDVSGIGQCFRQADIIFHRILDLRLLILFRLAGGFGIAVFIRFQSDFLAHRLYGVLRQRIKALAYHFFDRLNQLRLGLRSRRHTVLRHIGDSAAIRVNRRVFHRRRKRILYRIHCDGRIEPQISGIALSNPDRSRAADLREIAVRRICHRGRCRRRAVCPAGNQSRYIIFDFIDGNSGSGCDRLHRFLFGETARNLDIVIHRRIRHDAARRHILHFGRHAIYRIIHARRRHGGESFTRLFRRADAHARRLLHAGIRRRIGNGRHVLKRHAIHGGSRRLQEIVSGHAA